MEKYIDAITKNPLLAGTVGIFTIMLFFFLAQRTSQSKNYKDTYDISFWPGAFAIGFLWDYLFVAWAIIKNFPDFQYRPQLIGVAVVLACVIFVALWIYNLKKLQSVSKAIGIFLKQLIASVCTAPLMILFPIMAIMAINSANDDKKYSSGRRKRTGHSLNPWHDK